jgi:hypothetical protein
MKIGINFKIKAHDERKDKRKLGLHKVGLEPPGLRKDLL